MASMNVNLSNKDVAGAIKKTVIMTVKIKPVIARWWGFRLRLAVQIARLAAWVGGTGLEIGDSK